MTRIDFYILRENNERSRQVMACRLAEKAYQHQLKTYIHAASSADAEVLDDLLWTFRDRSFLPHAVIDSMADGPGDNDLPIVVGSGDAPGSYEDVLINLTSEVPEFFSRFDRVVEVVDGDSERRRLGRDRYRFYKDRGYALSTHEVDTR